MTDYMKDVKKETILNLVGFLLVAVAVIIASTVVSGALKSTAGKDLAIKQKELNEKIAFDCAQTYRYTKTLKDQSVVSYPMDTEYRACLQEKGL